MISGFKRILNHKIFINIPAVCLKELKIFVPEAVIMGNAATLTCQYDLDNVRRSILDVNVESYFSYITGEPVLSKMVL